MSEADIALKPETLSPTATEPVGSADATAVGSKRLSTAAALLQKVFSFPAMMGIFLVGRVFFEARGFFVDPDLWWHIKVGQDILATHHFPNADIYSFTVNGHPWMAYEWLGELVFALAAKMGGVFGLEVMLVLLSSAVVLALYGFATIRSGNSKAGFVSTLLLCSLAFASFNMRPQMFGYLFLLLVLIALEKFHRGQRKAVWWLPLLFLVWVNVHGSFIIGIGVVVVHLLAGLKGFRAGTIEARQWTPSERMQLEGVLLACLAVLPFTPYGTRVAVYPFDMALSQPVNVANILEWQPMPFNILGGKMFLGAVLGFFLIQMVLRIQWRLSEMVLLFGGIAMACLHVRFLLIFVPFFAPLFANVLARWMPAYEPRKDKFVLNGILMAGVMVAIVHYFPTRQDIEKIVARDFPVQALSYLEQHPVAGPMFNTYGFGGYLVYSGQKVFIDGRGDLYERGGVLTDYLAVSLIHPGSFSVLDRYGVQSCILSRGEPMAVVLLASPHWQRAYSDNTSEIFVRR